MSLGNVTFASAGSTLTCVGRVFLPRLSPCKSGSEQPGVGSASLLEPGLPRQSLPMPCLLAGLLASRFPILQAFSEKYRDVLDSGL